MKGCLSILLIWMLFAQTSIGQLLSELKDYPNFFAANEYYSKYLMNPGYTGIQKAHEFMFDSYGPWVGFENDLVGYSLSYNGFIPQIKSGVGLNLNFQSHGKYDKKNEISAFYNYSVVSNEKYSLLIGVKFGIVRRKLSEGMFVYGTGNNKYLPAMDFGAVLVSDHLSLGVAVKNLIESKIEIPGYVNILNSRGLSIDASYTFQINEHWNVNPYITDFYYRGNSVALGFSSDLGRFSGGLGYYSDLSRKFGTIAFKFWKRFQTGLLLERIGKTSFNELVIKATFGSKSVK